MAAVRIAPQRAFHARHDAVDRGIASTIERQRIAAATLQQKQDLAAVIHVCGAGRGDTYARGGFRLTARQRCGDHDVAGYLDRVNMMKRVFARLAAAPGQSRPSSEATGGYEVTVAAALAKAGVPVAVSLAKAKRLALVKDPSPVR